MASRFIKNTLLFLIAVTVILSGIFFTRHTNYTDDIGFEYYEDSTGKMDLEKIQTNVKSGMFVPNKKDSFSFGKSSSTYWIRIPLGEMKPHTYKNYISIYNPTVTNITLYLPIRDKDTLSYKKFSSGWNFREDKQDEGFFYPVFHWDENTDFKKDAYVQVYSRFTQNYRINFLSYNEFEQTKRNNTILYGILYGILLSVIIQNFFTFIELKDKAYLYYFFYIFFMMLYQGTLLGIYNVFIEKYSKYIMANTITLALITFSASIIFFRVFFRTKETFSIYDRILKGLLVFVLGGGIFVIGNQYVLANLYAHSISNLGAIFLMFVAFQAYKKGFKEAKLFMLGWMFMIISLVISFFRNSSWIPNNVITINITFIAVAIQSILLSAALVQMVKVLSKEKQKALIQYKKAEKKAQSNEIAFLHAQIKPHFLYNSLNVIISLCRIDPEKARELLLDLSQFLRYSFDFHKEQKFVWLKDELEYVQAYVRIEQARFRNKLNVVYEIGESCEFKIPPLVLQPLVENAIIHGIRKRKAAGRIVLRVKEKESDFSVEVEDNGVGMAKEKIDKILSHSWYKGKRVGIANINKRLYKFYGEGLNIKSIPEEGTVVSFRIPKEAEYANSYARR